MRQVSRSTDSQRRQHKSGPWGHEEKQHQHTGINPKQRRKSRRPADRPNSTDRRASHHPARQARIACPPSPMPGPNEQRRQGHIVRHRPPVPLQRTVNRKRHEPYGRNQRPEQQHGHGVVLPRNGEQLTPRQGWANGGQMRHARGGLSNQRATASSEQRHSAGASADSPSDSWRGRESARNYRRTHLGRDKCFPGNKANTAISVRAAVQPATDPNPCHTLEPKATLNKFLR
jgi:type V secretory pathway adhesin AidA